MRLSPCEDPRSCPGSNCSKPITSSPRFARLKSAALPVAPSPITAASYTFATKLRPLAVARARAPTGVATGGTNDAVLDRGGNAGAQQSSVLSRSHCVSCRE